MTHCVAPRTRPHAALQPPSPSADATVASKGSPHNRICIARVPRTQKKHTQQKSPNQISTAPTPSATTPVPHHQRHHRTSTFLPAPATVALRDATSAAEHTRSPSFSAASSAPLATFLSEFSSVLVLNASAGPSGR